MTVSATLKGDIECLATGVYDQFCQMTVVVVSELKHVNTVALYWYTSTIKGFILLCASRINLIRGLD